MGAKSLAGKRGATFCFRARESELGGQTETEGDASPSSGEAGSAGPGRPQWGLHRVGSSPARSGAGQRPRRVPGGRTPIRGRRTPKQDCRGKSRKRSENKARTKRNKKHYIKKRETKQQRMGLTSEERKKCNLRRVFCAIVKFSRVWHFAFLPPSFAVLLVTCSVCPERGVLLSPFLMVVRLSGVFVLLSTCV